MKLLATTLVSLALIASPAQAQETNAMPKLKMMLTGEDIRMVAPALDQYTQDRLLGDVWKRPGLVPRDRSIVTIAALIARNQTIEMPYHFNLALDNSVKPREISEIITHLAFYTGWANAMSAVAVAKDVFAARKIGSDELPRDSVNFLPLDEAAEAQRAIRVGEQFGVHFPGISPSRRCPSQKTFSRSDRNNKHRMARK
jgi:4-carboxymuconolactone decarboxylase